MNFESPNIVPEDKKENESTVASKLKKATLAGGAVAAALSGEACSPNTGEATRETVSMQEKGEVHPETATSRLRQQYELGKKQSQHEGQLLVDNAKTLEQARTLSNLDLSTNKFLNYYYQGLNGERNEKMFEEARNMRALEIAKSKGIEVDLSGPFVMTISGGLVPESVVVNGITVPVSDSDYTPREKELVAFAKKTGGESTRSSSSGSGGIRASPDFDKDADF